MPLLSGARLGPYEITALIGAGGMGEVYRARDTKLKRDVALKVLPDAFAGDAGRMARFEREAEVLASLNHPNIAHIYGIEERALVMELVEGQTLPCPVPVDTALAYAKQIVEALEYAHDRGVIHRDLKPANIKVTPEGVVKVLDFGLAKVLDDDPPPASGTDSPTMTLGHTRAGMILGTAAYMSPEQAVGKPADRRSDIFSFGSVLYEMLTGQRAFSGEGAGETLVAVAKDEPDWSKLPAGSPEALLRRCLTKDRKQRLQAIGEARIALENPVGQVSGLPSPGTGRRPVLLASVAAVLAVALAGVSFLHFRESPAAQHHLRYTIAGPENGTVHSFAVSPDGRYVVIAAAVSGKPQLWLRPLDALQAQPMPFTEGAVYPFWSPDSRFIGFFAQGKLKKVAASGGPSQSLCDVLNNRGGSWSRDDVIVISPTGAGSTAIQRVSAAGGVPVDVTSTKGDYRHPVFLPDGRRFLYLSRGATAERNGIYVSSLDGKENRRILADVSGMAFAPPAPGARAGHILFIRENTLMAIPFDPGIAQVAGDVFPVADGVSVTTNGSYAPVTVSDNGVLLYSTGGGAFGTNQIAWYDRSGKLLGPVGAPGQVFDPAVSPDEKTIAFRRIASNGADLWLRDLNRGTEQRFTTNTSTNAAPAWSPKGDRIAFLSTRKGVPDLFQKAASGSGQDEPLFANTNGKIPAQWSRDGRFVVYQENDPKMKWDIWVFPMDGPATDRKPVLFLGTEFNEGFGQLSPDSHWMAYTSDKTGRNEVYVRPFPPGEGEWPISAAGGEQSRWRGDGRELYFEAADGKMMVVPVLKAVTGVKPSFQAGAPQALFEAHMVHPGGDVLFEYDVTADGKRFLIDTTSAPGAASAPPLTVVLNWLSTARNSR